MKYLAPAAMFLANNEILSMLALLIMSLMFFYDILRAREAL